MIRTIFVFFIFLPLISGCGLTMEEVNQELLPKINETQRHLTQLKETQDRKIDELSRSVISLEKDISDIKDKIKSMEIKLAMEIAEQNKFLNLVNEMELKVLEARRSHLDSELKGLEQLIEQQKQRTEKGNARSKNTPAPEGGS
ncbi:MAG: hypothetical protein AB7F75_03130, partial [Planctomycetota bacterium]